MASLDDLRRATGAAPRRNPLPAIVMVALWLPVVIGGLVMLWNYATSAGAPGNPPATWPTASRISRHDGSSTLVMVVHPHCPCSRASIGELAELMAHVPGHLSSWVLFVRPPGFDEDWARTDLWSSAASIPGVRTMVDDEGREARLFGAETSGETLLYDSKGKLLFAGGVTGARGHYGDNAGLSAVSALIDQPDPHRTATSAVYGCPLFAPSHAHSKGAMTCSR